MSVEVVGQDGVSVVSAPGGQEINCVCGSGLANTLISLCMRKVHRVVLLAFSVWLQDRGEPREECYIHTELCNYTVNL